MADVKRPLYIIKEVETAVSKWSEIAQNTDIDESHVQQIAALHRHFL